jgi:hypothetical protein
MRAKMELKMKKTIKLLWILFTVAILAGCASMTLVSVDTIEGPKQVRQGEDISPRDIIVYGIYKNGDRKVVSVSASNINFDKNTPGPQTVIVRVGNQAASFQTEVMALRSVIIATPPRTVLFKQGQEPERGWPGLDIQGEWDQMGRQRIDVASCEISGYTSSRPGIQTITVKYGGMTATFDVEVRAMTSIRIVQLPTKVDYIQGEALALAGLRVEGVWEGLPSEDLSIAASEVTGYNANSGGIQYLTVTKNGISATFEVDVWRLTGIMLDKPPAKTDYVMGEQLVLTGIEVSATYVGSTAAKRSTVQIPMNQLTVTGYNPNTIGNQQRVTVTVGEFSANFFVNVALPTPTNPLVGTWSARVTANGITATITWVFNNDGTGTYVSIPFSWMASGNTLTITTPGTTDIYAYSISGNTLTLTGSTGSVQTYSRQ